MYARDFRTVSERLRRQTAISRRRSVDGPNTQHGVQDVPGLPCNPRCHAFAVSGHIQYGWLCRLQPWPDHLYGPGFERIHHEERLTDLLRMIDCQPGAVRIGIACKDQGSVALFDVLTSPYCVVRAVGLSESPSFECRLCPQLGPPTPGNQAARGNIQAPPHLDNAAVCTCLAAADELLNHTIRHFRLWVGQKNQLDVRSPILSNPRSLHGGTWRPCEFPISARSGARSRRVVPTMLLERPPDHARTGKPSANTSSTAQTPKRRRSF